MLPHDRPAVLRTDRLPNGRKGSSILPASHADRIGCLHRISAPSQRPRRETRGVCWNKVLQLESVSVRVVANRLADRCD
jgi:hypothetical protein